MRNPKESELRPWETAEIPEVRYRFQCYGDNWHDSSDFGAAELYWWDGDERDDPGWLCRLCHFEHFSSYQDPKTGAIRQKDQALLAGFPDYLAALVTLKHELDRRAGLNHRVV